MMKLKAPLLPLFVFLVFLCRADSQRNGNKFQMDTDEIRFNKFNFPSYILAPKGFKPLMKDDYPITGFVNQTLRISNAYSVITPDDYEVVYNVPKIIEAVGGLPPQPQPNPNAAFWKVS